MLHNSPRLALSNPDTDSPRHMEHSNVQLAARVTLTVDAWPRIFLAGPPTTMPGEEKCPTWNCNVMIRTTNLDGRAFAVMALESLPSS